MSDVLSYKCPSCGAPLAFDIKSQKWDCNFCSSSFVLSQLEGEEAARPDKNEDQPFEYYDENATAYDCPSCGGRIITDKNTAATFCVYCHNPTIIASRLKEEYLPNGVIPFKLEKDSVVKTMRSLLKKRPLLPKDFKMYAEKGEISGLYVPFWLFDSEIDSTMVARGTNITSWRDSRYIYTKTDTYHVERAAHIAFEKIPADGSLKMDDKLMQALEPFDYSQLVPFSMGYLSGHFAENYDIDSNASSTQPLSRMRQEITALLGGTMIGYTTHSIINHDMKVRSLRPKYVMLPVWVLSTVYKGKPYLFAMNGQTGKISGNLPVSLGRIFAIFGIITSVITAIFTLGGQLL